MILCGCYPMSWIAHLILLELYLILFGFHMILSGFHVVSFGFIRFSNDSTSFLLDFIGFSSDSISFIRFYLDCICLLSSFLWNFMWFPCCLLYISFWFLRLSSEFIWFNIICFCFLVFLFCFHMSLFCLHLIFHGVHCF